MILKIFISLAAVLFLTLYTAAAQTWSPLGKGTNSSVVNALIKDEAGNLYAGGDFFKAGDVIAEGIAKWDGLEWSALGSGVDGQVLVLKYFNNILHVGGEFINAGGQQVNTIATWDGATWKGFGEGMFKSGGHTFTTGVRDMAMYKGELYAAGVFDFAGGKKATYIARWTGTTWEPVGTGISGSYVNSMAVYNDELYVGGSFGGAGGQSAKNIAKWNGTSWSAVGDGFNGFVSVLKVHNGVLYCGGGFTASGSIETKYLATWNGESWNPLSDSTNNSIFSISFWNDKLIAGGVFTQAGTISTERVAMYDGNTWSAIGTGMNDMVKAVYVDSESGILYAGGRFTKAGDVTVNHIAKTQLVTGIAETEADSPLPHVFPQPATHKAVIRVPHALTTTPYTISVKNTLGQEIISTPETLSETVEIHRGAATAGVYYYTITDKKGNTSHGVLVFE